MHVLNNELEGVYNGVAPSPKTNEVLTRQLAQQLKRPYFMPKVPAFLMKLILGEMHILLIESQRVSSKKIEAAGYEFKHHCLSSALKDIYNLEKINTSVSSFS